MEGPEEVVYYDEEFYTDVNGNIVEDPADFNEDSFSQQVKIITFCSLTTLQYTPACILLHIGAS